MRFNIYVSTCVWLAHLSTAINLEREGDILAQSYANEFADDFAQIFSTPVSKATNLSKAIGKTDSVANLDPKVTKELRKIESKTKADDAKV